MESSILMAHLAKEFSEEFGKTGEETLSVGIKLRPRLLVKIIEQEESLFDVVSYLSNP